MKLYRVFALTGLLTLAACAPDVAGPAAVVPAASAWRGVATEADRERLREWRTAFLRALTQARTAGHADDIAREGALLEPDAAVGEVTPPAGLYRCRTIKLGAKSEGMLNYVAYPAFRCRISATADGNVLDFTKETGSQRPVGRLFPENGRRMVFLGTLQLGDEQAVLRYGHDVERGQAAFLERVGDRRWRLIFPYPRFESTLDVIELLPAE
jgi:hypothetical protein